MKKTTQQPLSKRLAQYGAFSLAIAGITDANGQIVYTDINPDVGGAGVLYFLDLNNDAINDFFIGHFNSATYGGAGFYNWLAAGADNLNNAILGFGGAYYEYPFALNPGAIVSAGQTTWINDNFQTLNFNSCLYSNSNWCANSGDKYLGLRFTLGGNLHYGWARIEIGATSSDWLIKDYAYNTTPGASITAGQGSLAVEESPINLVRVVALNKSIALYNLPENLDYNLFSVSGQSVLKGNITSDTYVIEANTAATGVYLLELIDKTTGEMIRKKIVL